MLIENFYKILRNIQEPAIVKENLIQRCGGGLIIFKIRDTDVRDITKALEKVNIQTQKLI